MINEVVPGIFRLIVPLPRNPLRSMNAYLIKGQERHLLIDTGFDWLECEQALREGLGKLEVNLADVDFLSPMCTGIIQDWSVNWLKRKPGCLPVQ